MYWVDDDLNIIERAYLNGTGRRTLLTRSLAVYIALAPHDDIIYFTDWHDPQYV